MQAAEEKLAAENEKYAKIKLDFDRSRATVTRTNYEVDFIDGFTKLAALGAKFNPVRSGFFPHAHHSSADRWRALMLCVAQRSNVVHRIVPYMTWCCAGLLSTHKVSLQDQVRRALEREPATLLSQHALV